MHIFAYSHTCLSGLAKILRDELTMSKQKLKTKVGKKLAFKNEECQNLFIWERFAFFKGSKNSFAQK